MSYSAKVICDSISSAGVRLTTIEATFPRFILAEVNTHRVLRGGDEHTDLFDLSDYTDLSRSSASSRAIPIEKRIRMVEEDPFIPAAFGKNQRGMQAAENLEGEEAELARDRWNRARSDAMYHAGGLARLGVHKQYANRLLEPFCWHTAVLTATEWGNVDALRDHKDAQPEFQTLWKIVKAARASSTPKEIGIGEWHLPYVRDVDEEQLIQEGLMHDLPRISCARAGRVSYLTQDGRRAPGEDIALYGRYLDSFHMSPLEHAATPYDGYNTAHRRVAMCRLVDTPLKPQDIWIGNLRGWCQQRKLIANEHDFSLRGDR